MCTYRFCTEVAMQDADSGTQNLRDSDLLVWCTNIFMKSPCHADEEGLVAVIAAIRGILFKLHVLPIPYGVKTCFATKLNFQLYHLVTMI